MSTQSNLTPPDSGKILIVGGYGKVGYSIAEKLAPLFPGRVTIAGRNFGKAKTAAAAIGHGAEGRVLDIFSSSSAYALYGVALVVVCLDQSDTSFVEQCLARAIHYVDISADYQFLSRVEKLDDLAKQNGASAVLSVGVAPGLTNMLAARAKEKMEAVERIDILLELGLGDHHGQAALEWMFDNLDAKYQVKENGRLKSVSSFGEYIKIGLPGQRKPRPAYRFDFSDQHVIARTLKVSSASTWIRFEDRVSTWLFAKSSMAGLGRLLRRGLMRKFAVWLFMNVHIGSDVCGVAAQASGRTKSGAKKLMVSVIGRREALMTATVAAETARQLLTRNLAAGVHHSEQVIALDPVVAALKKEQPDLRVAL